MSIMTPTRERRHHEAARLRSAASAVGRVMHRLLDLAPCAPAGQPGHDRHVDARASLIRARQHFLAAASELEGET